MNSNQLLIIRTKTIYLSILIVVLHLPLISSCQENSVSNSENIIIGKTFSIHSKVLKDKRDFKVLLPPSYNNTNQGYPVIYVLDGSSYYLAAVSTTRTLSAHAQIPECIIVAISNKKRESEFTPPYMKINGVENPKADALLEYFKNELIPHIEKNYRTKPLRILMGHSHGGIFNIYSLTESPELFNWHLIIDAPMHLDKNILKHKLNDFISSHEKNYGRIAVVWENFPWDLDYIEELKARSTNYEILDFKLYEEANHADMYYLSFYKGLKQLFFDYVLDKNKILPYENLKKQIQEKTEAYGYDVKIPKNILQIRAVDYLAAADYENAKLYVEELVSEYGSAYYMKDDLQEWLGLLKHSPPAESRKSYLSKPDAKPDQLKPFSGLWTDENTGNQFKLRLKNDNPKGLWTQIMPNGEQIVMNIEKFVITDNRTLEVVYSNKMTPRSALIKYRLEMISDNELNVTQEFLMFWPRLQSRIPKKQFNLFKNQR